MAPPGGHLEPHEIPDDATLREINEETGLNAKIIDVLPLSINHEGIVRQTSVPFYTNIHSVGDHDHYGSNFLCVSDTDNVKINRESKRFKWVRESEIQSDREIRQDIKEIALAAFSHYKRIFPDSQI